MQEIRKNFKKVAAIGTSIAMLGMTLTGALAADLSGWPQPFGGSDTIFVLGSQAAASDSSAAEDIAMGLPASGNKAAVSAGSAPRAPSARRGANEKIEDLPINTALNDTNDGFGNTVDADDLEGFQDTTIDIDIGATDDDYDIRDEIRFGGTEITPSDLLAPHTGLTWQGGDPDFAERVFIPMVKNSWGYFYVFEDTLLAGNNLSASSNNEPIEIEFLGKLFQIEGTNNAANKLIVNVGQKFFLNAGDTVVVDGKEVTLVQTAAAQATLSVDGVREVIAENDDERVNGLEIRVEDVSSDEGIEFDSATLFIGEKARETFSDGEEFVGEDEDDPAWTWRLANLNLLSPTIGIRWSLDLDFPEENNNPLYEHPIYEGESICLPFDYACIEFEGIQIDDYQDYEIIGGVSEDLYNSQAEATDGNKSVTGARVIEIRAKGANDDGLQCRTSLSDATLVDTDTIHLDVNRSTGALLVHREEQDGSKSILCNALVVGGGNSWVHRSLNSAFKIEFRDALIDVDLSWLIPGLPTDAQGMTYGHGNTSVAWHNSSVSGVAAVTNTAPAYGYMHINPVIGGKNVTVYFETDEAKTTTTANSEWADFEYLGDSDGASSTKYDVVYGDVSPVLKAANNSASLTSSYLVTGAVDISEYEENTRTQDGVIILDPEAHQSSDKFEFRVPSDMQDFKANIVIRTAGSAGASEVITQVGAQTPATGPRTILDTDVGDLSKYNAIVVGGPAINEVAATLLGLPFPTSGASGNLPFGEGQAIIQMHANGDKWALLVAGYEAIDTRRAGVVLKNADSFQLSGSSVTVTGESLEVDGINVE